MVGSVGNMVGSCGWGGSVWDQCGISVGSVWDQYGISVGSVLDQCGVSVGSVSVVSSD